MTVIYGIYGVSGFGREMMATLRQAVREQDGTRFVFVDDFSQEAEINGHPVLCFSDFVEQNADRKYISLAIADSKVRADLDRKCEEAGLQFFFIKAENSIVKDNVDAHSGTIVKEFVILSSNVKIGKHFHANSYSYVAHDCVIGDFVTFAPAVKCNGNVHIGDHAYIGTGAIIKQGRSGKPLVIGAGAVIGMGAVVTKDVPPGVTVVGNPAKPLVKA